MRRKRAKPKVRRRIRRMPLRKCMRCKKAGVYSEGRCYICWKYRQH